MKLRIIVIFSLILFLLAIFYNVYQKNVSSGETFKSTLTPTDDTTQVKKELHPLSIQAFRERIYPGSEIKIERELSNSALYTRYLASYSSEDHKIFGILAVPNGEKPEAGWPAIVFNHGYIQPEGYINTQKYVAYIDYLSRNGYVVFMSDYRGHGDSEGDPEGGYFSPAYTIDVLNAFESIRNYPEVDSDNVGMWGHSMGGSITLRSMVVSSDVKASVIWAGVVSSYEDIIYNWPRTRQWTSSNREVHSHRSGREDVIKEFGEPKDNKEFWNSLSAIEFVEDISGPVQLHHGTGDAHVPSTFSEKLENKLKEANKEVELYLYDTPDHNLGTPSFEVAMTRTVEYFDKYLKDKE